MSVAPVPEQPTTPSRPTSVIVAGARTPIGKLLGSLKGFSATDLGGLAIKGALERAQVAPATAYTYFSSKNHLIAEAYLDLIRQTPYFTDVNETRLTRLDSTLRSMALAVADEPEVAAACTTALLGGGNDDAVGRVRERIGAEIHRRITSAYGPDPDQRLLSALEMTFFGALVQAGSGYFTYHQIADRLAYAVSMILGENK